MQIDNNHGKLGKTTLHSDDFSTEEPTVRVEQATTATTWVTMEPAKMFKRFNRQSPCYSVCCPCGHPFLCGWIPGFGTLLKDILGTNEAQHFGWISWILQERPPMWGQVKSHNFPSVCWDRHPGIPLNT
jgi:hypothetical protein